MVDGQVGYTGGINISSVYSRSSAIRQKRSPDGHPWRDTQIEVRGPAVSEFQKLFLENWNTQHCESVAARTYFPTPNAQGDTLVRTLGSSPRDELNLIYVELISAIMHAGSSIHITMAYFVPDRQTVEAFKDAARRGVDVRLVLPSFSDYWITFHAGRSYYAELLQAGVKIYERKNALLHAKTAVIDRVWATVGSSNIDARSFLHNDEVNVIVLGSKFGEQMEQMFAADLSQSEEIFIEAWEKRPQLDRMKESLARMWAYWL